jgi:DNA-binding LacI/PurR family transcriptional regulator/serine phosphatase RsbU (regulator of sigma subunit)
MGEDPKKKAPRIGVLIDRMGSHYTFELASALADAGRRRSARLVFFVGGQLETAAATPQNRGFDLASPDNIEGLIVTSISYTLDQPSVARLVGRFESIPRCTLGIRFADIPYVQTDNHRGMRALVTHLVRDHACRRVAFIGGPETNPEAELRLRVYRETVARLGMPDQSELLVFGDFSEGGGRLAARELIERGVEFDAVIGANDHSAIGALHVFRERGIRVPEQVALAGFDDIPEASAVSPPLTTVRQAWRPQAEAALDIVLSQLAGDPPPEGVTVRAPMVIRRSCRCFSEVARGAALGAPPAAVVGFETALGRAEQSLSLLGGYVAENGWERSVVRRFATVLEGGQDVFLETIDSLASASSQPDKGAAIWQEAISILRRDITPALSDSNRRMRAEDIWHQARIVVSEAAMRRHAHERINAENTTQRLAAAAEALIARFDVTSLPGALVEQLGPLEIKSCFLALYEGGRGRSETARLVLAFKDGQLLALSDEERLFPTALLLPAELWSDERALVVEPLFFEEVELGFVLLEFATHQGALYEGLRQLLSAALQGATLVRQVAEQAERRGEADRERLGPELEIARRIQGSILPRSPRVRGLSLAAGMQVAAEAGGDYYDVLPARDGCWLGVGDVAGHGLGAGLVMLMLQSVVASAVACDDAIGPARLVEVVNRTLFENVRGRLGQDEHATLVLLRYYESGQVAFAGGHEDIVVLRHNAVAAEVFPTVGPWVGATADLSGAVEEQELRLARGDLVLLFTDGVIEARNAGGQQFGLERLRRELEQRRDESVETIQAELMRVVRSWTALQEDDVTLVVFRYEGV